MKLYMTEGSGNAYKVRLLLSMLDVPYEKAIVDFKSGEHKKEPFLKLNPRGQVPVVEDGGRTFWGSTACLAYVARKHGGEKWLPTEPTAMAEVMQWLEVAQNELHYGLQWARGVVTKIRAVGNLEEYSQYGRNGLALLEGRLAKNEWLALGRPTIADVACYPYVSVAPEGNFRLEDYPAVMAWVKRFGALPGWVKRV
ncbi:MAG: glutathione S-transferase family protein [Betaproteobacteria bacterium]|nr:glutathione S-transferase family protein [Betaproteobacteria bacterium]